MKARLPIGVIWVLAACSQDVRSLELADVDFTDMETVQQIRHDLPPEDRAVFSTYIVRHVATSSSFCGEKLVDSDGREPLTLGEALALTVLREERDRRERLAAERPLSAAESARRQHEALIQQREALIARQTYLIATLGPGAKQSPEWESTDTQMAEVESKLSAMQAGGAAH